MSNNKFEPKKYLIKVKGKDYLEVKFRLHWFRSEHPDWDINTELIKLDIEKGIAVARADISDKDGIHKSAGIKMEYQKNFADYVEKASTGAIGRALASLGYGTLQSLDLEEGRIVDSSGGYNSNTNYNASTGNNNNTPRKASQKQVKFINDLLDNFTREKQAKIMKGRKPEDLNVAEAKKAIDYLQNKIKLQKSIQEKQKAEMQTPQEEPPFPECNSDIPPPTPEADEYLANQEVPV